MARRTSLEAWRAINQNGLLSKRRLEVYNVVFDFGPLTSAEAFRILNQNKPMGAITSSRARFTELRDAGVFYEVRERFCNATGRLAIEWDVTENLPIKKKKRKRIKCAHCDGRGFNFEDEQEPARIQSMDFFHEQF